MKKVCIGWDEEAYNSVLSHLEPFLSIFNNRVDRPEGYGLQPHYRGYKGHLRQQKRVPK